MKKIVQGTDPKLLIHTGTHGDEYDVIQMVEAAILKYKDKLPDYIFVPEVSPSAVKSKTRKNNFGHDMNRIFYSESKDPEVQENISIIKDRRFDLFVSIHEDPEFSEYYLYDVGYKKIENDLVLKHNQYLKDSGIILFSGVDDPLDPHLGYDFSEGYRKLIQQENEVDDGSISSWVLNRHIADEYLLPEIPQKLDQNKKRFIVDSFFSEVIVKSFQK